MMQKDLLMWEIKGVINELKTNSLTNLSFNSLEVGPEEEENTDNYYILSFYGGLNGRGKFLFYMETVEELVKKLMIRFPRVWLIKWENDCPDDVFDLQIGVSF